MNKESKRRHEFKKQIVNKVQTAELTTVQKILEVLNSPKKYDVVEKTTILSGEENIETQRFILSFEYLDWSQCNFNQFNQSKGKKLIEILEKISKCRINRFSELKLIRDSVSRTGEYKSLFRNLTPDVTKLNETELCEGRIFFYIVEPRFNIVSIETNHRNIDR